MSQAHVPVSVVIPMYRHIASLDRAIQSITNQTQVPDECIVVSDGVRGDEFEYLQAMLQKYNPTWLKLIRLPENMGAGYARNIGWDLAKNSLIAFLDADDAWHPKKIEVQYRLMNDNPDIALCGHNHRVENGPPGWNDYRINPSFNALSLFNCLIRNPFITPSIMLRANISKRFHSAQRYSEDYRLWLEVIASGYKAIKLNSELACVFKPLISHAGLSSNLLAMEYGELLAYWSVCKIRPLMWILFPGLVIYSLIKFVRRILIVLIQKCSQK
jgi:glycosyltransferase involved in cell wall biosynthesis